MEACVTTICLLGKTGDLIEALPIAWQLHKNGKVVTWVVSGQYFTVLLGASYFTLDRVHFHGGQSEEAMRYAESKYKNVINLHTWGRHWRGDRGVSYNRAMFNHAGLGHLFHDLTALPLVFDLRDKEREQFLIARQQLSGKPIMLVCVSCGRASPFSSHYVFIEGIKAKWGRAFNIVDICKLRAARLYDFLGIYEKAALLITGDTAALHLAAAVPSLPVIALVNNIPFQATCPRGPTLGVLSYKEALKRMADIHGWIGQALSSRQR